MKENLIHYRTSVCNINYHVVWSVKYRRKILNKEIEDYLKELVQQIAKDKGFTQGPERTLKRNKDVKKQFIVKFIV